MVGSREIKFDLDGLGGITMDAGRKIGFVNCEAGNLAVEQSRLLLDDKEIAKLPEDTKVVLVEFKAGTLTVTADGAIVYSSAAGK